MDNLLTKLVVAIDILKEIVMKWFKQFITCFVGKVATVLLVDPGWPIEHNGTKNEIRMLCIHVYTQYNKSTELKKKINHDPRPKINIETLTHNKRYKIIHPQHSGQTMCSALGTAIGTQDSSYKNKSK